MAGHAARKPPATAEGEGLVEVMATLVDLSDYDQ
jgi:hypothetical protein